MVLYALKGNIFMKITLSKSQWQQIGEKAGWIKTSENAVIDDMWYNRGKRSIPSFLMADMEARKPIAAQVAKAWHLKLPDGYTLEGDNYVFKGIQSTPQN